MSELFLDEIDEFSKTVPAPKQERKDTRSSMKSAL